MSTVRHGARSHALAQLGGADWVWPYWLERQLDPRSPSFVPRGVVPAFENVTQRNWTVLGTVSSGATGMVDPRGMVTPSSDGWSIDWWIGAEDRWHFPSREAAVRQQLVANTPVVETAMRIPNGDAVQRVYAVPGSLAVVEITNDTPTPIAVGLAVRPYNPTGLAVVERIGLHDGAVIVDGEPALLLSKRPQRMAASTFRDGDAVHLVTSESLATEFPEDLCCGAGLATATFLFPLAHRQTLRVAVPMGGERHRRSGRPRARSAPPSTAMPDEVPDSDAVVRAWQAQTGSRGMRLVLPDGRLASAVEANRRYLLAFHADGEVVPSSGSTDDFSFRDAAPLLAALDLYGFHRESAEVLASYPERLQAGGILARGREEWRVAGAALTAMADHWRLTGSVDHVDAEVVARAARGIERRRTSRRGRRDPAVRGLLPAGDADGHLGPRDVYYWDDFWLLRALLDAAALLRADGADPVAVVCDQWAASLRVDLEASMALTADRLGTHDLPAGPRRRIDAAVIGTLVACAPLRLLPADHPMLAATVQVIRDRFCVGPAFYDGISRSGLVPSLTLQLASVELEAGDRTALERLEWMLDVTSATFTWPEAIHPVLGGGCTGDGHDRVAAAGFLSFVRHVLVRETFDGEGLALCSMLPEAWMGQPLEVHDAPTHFGPLSFAIRYHGERPALLWDLKMREGVGPVRLTAPGLDPAWSTTDAKGETLLAASPLSTLERPALDAERSFT